MYAESGLQLLDRKADRVVGKRTLSMLSTSYSVLGVTGHCSTAINIPASYFLRPKAAIVP